MALSVLPVQRIAECLLELLLLRPLDGHAHVFVALLFKVQPVKDNHPFPECEVLFYAVSDVCRSVRKEYKSAVFHQPVLQQKRDKTFERLVYAYGRDGVLSFLHLEMNDGILHVLPGFQSLTISFWNLTPTSSILM